MELDAERRRFYQFGNQYLQQDLLDSLLVCSSSAEVPHSQSVFHSCVLADCEPPLCLSTGVFRALQYGFMKATVSESLLHNGFLEHSQKKVFIPLLDCLEYQ